MQRIRSTGHSGRPKFGSTGDLVVDMGDEGLQEELCCLFKPPHVAILKGVDLVHQPQESVVVEVLSEAGAGQLTHTWTPSSRVLRER
jgi:hypothetical protein